MSKPIPNSRMGSLFSKKKDTAITSNESRVMKHEHETAEPELMSNEPEGKSHESLLTNNESRDISRESLPMNRDSGIMKIDPQALNAAISQGCKDPRISTYSPFVMSVLRYLRKTTPEFSMSEMASDLLENAIREKYPELSGQVKKALSEKR
jgi:hypothetical protein